MRCPCEKEGEGFIFSRPPLLLPLLPLSGIRLHFEGERRHASRTRTSGGKQTGPDSSNRGSRSAARGALGVNQSWTAKLILIRGETDRIRGEEIVQALSFAMCTERADREKKKKGNWADQTQNQMVRNGESTRQSCHFSHMNCSLRSKNSLCKLMARAVLHISGSRWIFRATQSLWLICWVVFLFFFITSCRLWCGL